MFGKPFQFPKFPKPGFLRSSEDNVTEADRPDWLKGLPSANAAEANEAGPQNMLQDWNQKSKDFFAERKQSFDAWNSRMKERSQANWENFTNGLKSPFSRNSAGGFNEQARFGGPFDWLKSNQKSDLPAQPPIRSAQLPNQTPKIKF